MGAGQKKGVRDKTRSDAVNGQVAWFSARARTPAPPLTAAAASAGAAPASTRFSAAATWPKLKPPAPPPRCWPLAAGGGAAGCGLLTRVDPPCAPASGVTGAQMLARQITLACRPRGWARPAQHSRSPLRLCLASITARPPASALQCSVSVPPRMDVHSRNSCSPFSVCCCAHADLLAAFCRLSTFWSPTN